MTLEVERNEIAKFQRRLKAVARRAENPEGVWPRVGQYLSFTANRQFVTEGMYLLGRPWKPLTSKYRLRKIRMGGSRKILRFSGDMASTLTSRPMSIEQYSGDTATFGSRDPKVAWHHRGTYRDGKRVNPPRPILPFNETVREDIKEIMIAYVTGDRRATWR